ncbi:hypothetical protein BDZ91DRAFT_719281 [Kalaharituber pfeilii]|nr:hypothetical protein BDZ91DRAFT_719281 [Kalaharituber pfeilii]
MEKLDLYNVTIENKCSLPIHIDPQVTSSGQSGGIKIKTGEKATDCSGPLHIITIPNIDSSFVADAGTYEPERSARLEGGCLTILPQDKDHLIGLITGGRHPEDSRITFKKVAV